MDKFGRCDLSLKSHDGGARGRGGLFVLRSCTVSFFLSVQVRYMIN